MKTNYSVLNGGVKSDFGDLFIPRYLFSQGGLWAWGENANGRLGDNSVINKSSPVLVASGGTNWRKISAGGTFTAAIKSDGTLWTWGSNMNGQLGNNTTTSRSSPVQIAGGGTTWYGVSCGWDTAAAVKSDGSLWLWGCNSYGQLGDNSVIDKSSPVQTASGGYDWKQVACGTFHTAAIKTNNSLWTWGGNANGQLMLNDIVDRSNPTLVTAGGFAGTWKSVSAGELHTTGIDQFNRVQSGGYNADGQLGVGDTIDRSVPTQMPSGSSNWQQVSAGGSHTVGIKTDGTLWAWGRNIEGQLGDNSTTNASSPIQTVGAGTNWKQTSAGASHTAAIKKDGSLWTWGEGASGELGNNDSVPVSSPVQTIAAGNNWNMVSCNGVVTVATTDIF